MRLEGLSESLRRELLLDGIAVIIVAPGLVVTPIWAKAAQTDISPYAHTEFAGPFRRLRAYLLTESRRGLPSEQIGHVVWKALIVKRPRLRYAVVPRHEVPGMLLPRGVLDAVSAHMQRGAGEEA